MSGLKPLDSFSQLGRWPKGQLYQALPPAREPEGSLYQPFLTHCSTPRTADESCGSSPQSAVAIRTPSPIGSNTFQPTRMSWSKR